MLYFLQIQKDSKHKRQKWGKIMICVKMILIAKWKDIKI